MTVLKKFVKDPDASLVYAFDWANGGPNDASLDDDGWLQSAVITAASFVVPTGLTNVVDSFNDTTASVKLSGGKEGKNYIITNRVTTDLGETDDRSIEIRVRSR
jgi:hypothetical protein